MPGTILRDIYNNAPNLNNPMWQVLLLSSYFIDDETETQELCNLLKFTQQWKIQDDKLYFSLLHTTHIPMNMQQNKKTKQNKLKVAILTYQLKQELNCA